MAANGRQSGAQDQPLLMLMDGHALVHRAWHAIQQPLNVSKTGEEVRAVFGFMNTFLRAISDLKPTHCAISFDLPAPTFRHNQFAQYKAHRPAAPPELRSQFTRVREIVAAFRIPVYEVEDYEADDVIGTLARQAEGQDIETIVLTGDTDMLQLVSPRVRVLLSYAIQKQTLYDVTAVKQRYDGLGPEVVPDIKALLGDPSDNIPGVPGIGPKNAIRLLTEFGSIEGIYENLDRVKPERMRKALEENREQALQGKRLITISRDAPVTLDLERCRFWQYDRSEVVNVLRELEFASMVPRIPNPQGGDGQQPAEGQLALLGEALDMPQVGEAIEINYTVVDTEEALAHMVGELRAAGEFAFDTETTSMNAMQAELVGLSFAAGPGRGWYVPVGHREGKQLPRGLVLDTLRPVFEDEKLRKVAHNANYDMTVLENCGIQVRNLHFDTMLAAHLCGRKQLNLKAMVLEYLHQEMTPITELIGTGKKQIGMDEVPIEQAARYASADADFTQRLKTVLAKELEEKRLTRLFETMEIPLTPVLVRMQRNGVAVDVPLLKQMSKELGEQLAETETSMYKLVGHQFNINSSQQLGDVLFKELRLPPTKRTQKGYSTDHASLEALKEMLDTGKGDGVDPRAYDVLTKVLEYRQVSKIKSTYVDSLPSLVNPRTGRIHTSYNQTGSATGRVSSNDPNVQNIPVRTELGRRVRKAFVAEKAPEWTLLAADYSQIELRILAHYSQDPGLLEAFRKGEDIHAATASTVYGVALDAVNPEMRRIAKIMNFGVLYGLSPYGISQQTDLSPEEGARFIETYFGKYPGIRQYIESIKASVREKGYVESLLGRRRYIYEVRSSNYNIRSAGERMAINMPIQGTAADIIKLAMIRIHDRMQDTDMRSMMIVQVHDELIFEVPGEELEPMKAIVMELMPSAMKLDVPLEVELKAGYTWGDME